MTTVQEAWALAAADKDVSDRLWSDPAAFGKEFGLRGAALAELIGGVRVGIRGREESAANVEVIRAAIDVEHGWGSWPFAGAADSNWAQFVSMTQHHARQIASAQFYGVAPNGDTMARVVSWAEALRDEAIRRAEASEDVSVEVADALVAAKGLLDACERVQGRP